MMYLVAWEVWYETTDDVVSGAYIVDADTAVHAEQRADHLVRQELMLDTTSPVTVHVMADRMHNPDERGVFARVAF